MDQSGTTAVDNLAPAGDGWRGDDLAADAGRFALPAAAADELIGAVETHRRNPRPLEQIEPVQLRPPALVELMDEVKSTLTGPLGFALIDRLPLERLGEDGARVAHWLLCSMIQRPVAQNWKGDLIYDVTDTGRPPGNGVRPDKTNAEQNFHTDYSYNLSPPDYVALLCLRAAKSGGVSHIVSLAEAHDRLLSKRPDLLARLYRPFVFDRQREHAPDDVMTIEHALFEPPGARNIAARLSRFQVVNGHKLAGTPLDDVGAEALSALEQEMNAPGVDVSFHFEPGQIQIVDNRRIGHRRTGFEDWPDPARKRLLVRLWLRDWGARSYNG